jgi:hypothetical protein
VGRTREIHKLDGTIFTQKYEKGPRWFLHDEEIEGVVEVLSGPLTKVVTKMYAYRGASISNWCEEVTLQYQVTIKNGAGRTVAENHTVNCQDIGCFGLGRQ